MNKKKNSFRITSQYIKDLSFENKLAMERKSSKGTPKPIFNVDIKTVSLDKSTFEVSLICNVDAKIENQTVYLIEIVYCGLCIINDVSDLELKNILYSKVPAFIYPYARQIISNLTVNTNFPSINIGPIYFEDIKPENMKIDQ